MNFFKNKLVTIFSHLMVWMVLFSFPYLLSSGQNQAIQAVIVFSWIPLSFYALIFYTNYFVFIERFLFTKKTILFLVFNAVLIAFFIWLNNLMKRSVLISGVSEKQRNKFFNVFREKLDHLKRSLT